MGSQGATRRAVGVLAVAALALTGLVASPAAAAPPPTPPPWYTDLGSAYYAGYTISQIDPPVFSRQFGTYGPVTLTLDTNAPLTAFSWEGHDTDPITPGDDVFSWPPTWSAGGIVMVRADPFDACLQDAPTCQYYVTSGNTQEFFFYAGTPPSTCTTDPTTPGNTGTTGDPDPTTPTDPTVPTTTATTAPPVCTPDFDPELKFYKGQLVLNPIPTINPNIPAAPPGVDADGFVTFDASAAIDDLTHAAPGSFSWTLRDASGNSVETGSGPTFKVKPPGSGTYTVSLILGSAADAFTVTWTGTLGYTAPAPPAAAPAPTPAPSLDGGGGGTGGGGGGIPGIGFSNLAQRAPSTLTGGSGGSPNVIWLWRPEWFQPANETSELPRTDGQPEVRGERVIIVRSPGPHGASAGPWLAAVGFFGLFGGWWMISRRRRLRMLAEL